MSVMSFSASETSSNSVSQGVVKEGKIGTVGGGIDGTFGGRIYGLVDEINISKFSFEVGVDCSFALIYHCELKLASRLQVAKSSS